MRKKESEKRKVEAQDKLPIGKFLAWKSRDISLAAVTVIISGYLMLFCTDTLGMSAALVGTLMMVSKLFDGVTDLFAGFIVDNTNTRFGKGRPYEICIILEWICTVLLFFADDTWALPLKSVWVFIMYTFVYSIFNTMLNANQVPYMVRAFKGNRKVITKISSFGGIVSMFGSMIVSILFPRLLGTLVTASGAGSSGWRKLILIFAIPLATLGILRFLIVKEDPSIDAAQSSQKIKLKEVIVMLKTNKYAWALAGVMGLFNLVVGLGAGSYYFTYIVGDIGMFGIVSALAVILLPVMIVFPALIKKFSVANLFEAGAILAIIGYALVFFAKDNTVPLMIGILLSQLISLPLSYLLALCIMDLATYNEYKGLHRMEGTTGVISGFTSKSFGGIGTGLAGILLGAAGFVEGAAGDISAQPDSALLMIRCLYSIIPLICMVLLFVFAMMFGGLEKKMPEIEAKVKEMKEGQENDNNQM